jgi:hypothetical protein
MHFGIKASTLLLAGVIALIAWLDDFSSYFVWPLGLSSEVTVFYGDNRDVAFSVPDSMYRVWLSELTMEPIQPCEERCTRTSEIRFKVLGQVHQGHVCPWHGMTVQFGSRQFGYKTPNGLACLNMHTSCLDFVQPKIERETTQALFGSEQEFQSTAVYTLLKEQLVCLGAPTEIREENPGVYLVTFVHKEPWDPIGRRLYRVNTVSGEVKDRTPMRCAS